MPFQIRIITFTAYILYFSSKAMLVKNELNLFAISTLLVILKSLSLKFVCSVFFLQCLEKISFIVFLVSFLYLFKKYFIIYQLSRSNTST